MRQVALAAGLKKFVAQSLNVEWSVLHVRTAALSSIAVALCLAGGLSAGPGWFGMAATTGALATGFGTYQHFSGMRGGPMALAALGMGVCAWLGAVLAHWTVPMALAGGLIATLCGLAIQIGQASWWLTLQWCVAFFVASATPLGGHFAAERGLLVFGGGILQFALVSLGWRLFGSGLTERDPALPPPSDIWPPPLRVLRQGVRYAVIAGGMVALAILIETGLGVANGYWAPMTALIILRPSFGETGMRIAQRIAGTLAGAGLATLAAAVFRPETGIVAFLVVVLAWSSYALQRVNFAIFTASITATIVFLLALAGLPEPEAAWRRTLATLIGAGLALLAGALTALPIRRRMPLG